VTDDLDGGTGTGPAPGSTGTTGRPAPASPGGLGGQDSPSQHGLSQDSLDQDRLSQDSLDQDRLSQDRRGLHARGFDGRGTDEAGVGKRSTEERGRDGLGGADPASEGRRRVVRPASSPPVPGPAFAADAIQSGRFDEDDDEHYIPPPPPPLPALDPVAKGAWTALFGGPAFLLVTTTAGWSMPGWATFGAVAGFIGGFAVIVARMGDRPPRDSGPDDGAVI